MSSCHCTGHNGKPKNLYIDKYQALEQKDFALIDRGVRLKEIPCKQGKGWHLTSNINPW